MIDENHDSGCQCGPCRKLKAMALGRQDVAQERDEFFQEAEQLRGELAALKAQLDEAYREYADLSADFTGAKAQLEQVTKERNQARKFAEYETFQKENDDLRTQLEAANAGAVALKAIAEAFASEAEAAVQHHENKNKGGQQVSFHGDFASIGPSVVGRLRWWVREFREALASDAGRDFVRREVVEEWVGRAWDDAVDYYSGPRYELASVRREKAKAIARAALVLLREGK